MNMTIFRGWCFSFAFRFSCWSFSLGVFLLVFAWIFWSIMILHLFLLVVVAIELLALSQSFP